MISFERNFSRILVATIIGGGALTAAAIYADGGNDETGKMSSDHELIVQDPTKTVNLSPVSNDIQGGYEDFKYRGSEYRHRIRALLELNPEEGKRLQEKYNVLLRVTEGKEYLDGGQEFIPKTGDVYEIDDPSISEPGIFLRQRAEDIFGNYSQKILFDGATVKITGEPVKVFDEFHNRDEVMFPISVESDSPYWETDYEALHDETGFVSQRHLGYLVEQTQTNR